MRIQRFLILPILFICLGNSGQISYMVEPEPLLDQKFIDALKQVSELLENQYEPSDLIEMICSDEFLYGNGENCGETKHCSGDRKQANFCFNGSIVKNQGYGANLMMMDFLCTDLEFIAGAPAEYNKIAFGACDIEQNTELLRVENKLSCNCENNPNGSAGWVCFDIRSE